MIVQYLPRDVQAVSHDEEKLDSGSELVSSSRRDCAFMRYGLTASKKVGNAVVRNRARRRLRALAEEVLPDCGLPCGDIVLIARNGKTVSLDYAEMKRDLLWSIRRLGANKSA